MARMLGAARISLDAIESTSIERQRDQITHTALAREDVVVAVTEDADVSGAVSPFARDSLGPWLTDPEKIAQWDVLCVAKLDRLTRNLRHFDDLRMWCDAHGKTIVSVSESLDLSSSVGRMFANLLAIFAQFERERISERRKEAAVKLRLLGAWGGGKTPYGFDAVRNGGGQYYLTVNEEQAAVVRDMAAMILAGQSARQVAIALNERGIPTSRGGRWGNSTVLEILRSPVIHGVQALDDRPVIGEDGMPVRLAESIIDDATFELVQERLRANASPGNGGHLGVSLLYGICGCACGAPLYIKRRKSGDRYRHTDAVECRNTYTAADVEGAVERHLLSMVGDVRRVQPTLIKGKGFGEAIARVEASTADLDSSFEAGEVPAAAYGRMQSKLEARLAELRAAHEAVPEEEREDRYEDVPTGETYAEHWAELDAQGRNAFLRDAGIRVTVAKQGGALTPDPPVRRGWDWSRTVAVKTAVIRVEVGKLSALRKLAALPPVLTRPRHIT